jgi:excisionase family DNA binding protein
MSSPDSNSILGLFLRASKEEGRRRSIADSLSQEVYSVPDAAGKLEVSTETLRRWIRAGKVETHPISERKTRIHKDELVRVMMGSRT